MTPPQQEPNHGPAIGTPAWVKVLATIAVVVVVLFIILHLTGHAPMGHVG